MEIKDNPKRFPNYDAHMFVLSNNNSSGYFHENVILASRGCFNASGGWITANAMHRWIDIYIESMGRGRMHTWTDKVMAVHRLSLFEA